MKKFLVVLLSLGLIAAFGMTASAADVKFSGSYYAVGWYSNNQTLGGDEHSAAAIWQRLRVQTVFQVQEGLSLTTRFDAMEKGWGSTDWRGKYDDMNLSRKAIPNSGSPKVQENFELERGYVTFKTAIGQFDVGYMSAGKWGTDFVDDEKTRPRVKFTTQMGPLVLLAVYEKQYESYYSSLTGAQAASAVKVDADVDVYYLAFIYNFPGGNAGVLYGGANSMSGRPSGAAVRQHTFLPYVKATFGPVYFESEVRYSFGKIKYESPAPAGTPDVDIDALGAYAKVRVNLGPAYFGGAAMYTPGTNPDDAATKKHDFVNGSGNGSQDLDVGLILGNDALQTWQQPGGNAIGNGGANGFAFDSAKYNSTIFSGFGGFDATPKLNIESVLLYARLNENVRIGGKDIVSKDVGVELDITAKYKIYDNLTYMVGAGYLWAGDAFKGNNNANRVSNDYLLMNRLTLSF